MNIVSEIVFIAFNIVVGGIGAILAVVGLFFGVTQAPEATNALLNIRDRQKNKEKIDDLQKQIDELKEKQ